jgi:2-dehydro-3-deoxy-D-arabinonate dehydratase
LYSTLFTPAKPLRFVFTERAIIHKETLMYLCRFNLPNQGIRLGLVSEGQIYDISARWASLSAFLNWSCGVADLDAELTQAISGAEPVGTVESANRAPDADALYFARPTDAQEIWAAGVTYERSRVAREEESAGSGIYERVYDADRPEIFLKATPSRVVGPFEAVVVREDAKWNVPEPELGLVVNPAMELVGYTVGNDMSSRDIEGENPLYLPQAKVYGRCCALGPLIALRGQVANANDLNIHLQIVRDGQQIFEGEVNTSKIVRKYEDLIGYLGRDNLFPDGVVLLTGTGIVPPDDTTLEAGDEVTITIDGICQLFNPVERGFRN